MVNEYRAEVINRLNSPPDVCVSLSVNGGFNLKKKFDLKTDNIWGKITQPISKDQLIDTHYKVLQRGNEPVVETSAQYRDYRYESGISIRCDNMHGDPNSFHLEKEVDISQKAKREWIKDLQFDILNNSELNKFRFSLQNVLQYVERNYDPLISPKFFFPFYDLGLDLSKSLKELKPEGISLSSYSEILSMITILQLKGKGDQNLENWVEEIILPATLMIKRAIKEGKSIILPCQGSSTIYPTLIFAPPRSRFHVEIYTPTPRRLNLEPLGMVLERKS